LSVSVIVKKCDRNFSVRIKVLNFKIKKNSLGICKIHECYFIFKLIKSGFSI